MEDGALDVSCRIGSAGALQSVGVSLRLIAAMWLQRQNCKSFVEWDSQVESDDEGWSHTRCSQDWGHMLQTQGATESQVQCQLETQVYKWHSEDLLETQEYATAALEDRLEPLEHVAVPMAKAKGSLKSSLKRKGDQKVPPHIYLYVYM